jgi:lipoprotein-anchoring transpeptidase ErfK/SrfK
MMIRRFGLVLLTLPAAAAISAVSAQAQPYPQPYYRSAPPAGPYSDDDRLSPPGYYDNEADVWVAGRPPRDPRYSQAPQAHGGPGGVPSRILPYPDEAEADAAAPPPPGFATPNGQPPAYGHQLDAQSPRPLPPGAQADPDAIRPPGAISPAQPANPQQQQQAAPQQAAPSNNSVMTLPPEDQPETGQPKELPANLKKQLVDYSSREPAGTLIVDTPNTYLYLVLGGGKALRYGIGVGREGFTWTGTERISRMKEWPDWFPPSEMIERQPYLPRVMAGGPGNPLGARALYLGNTLYRIHGTNQPSTIGQFVSSGCIRLLNEDIEDLYSRVQVGTRVVVLPGKQPETVASGNVPPAVSGPVSPAVHNPPAITSSQLPKVR